MAADETSIKVRVVARYGLAQPAAERGTIMRSLVEDLAQGTVIRVEYAERAKPARAELAFALPVQHGARLRPVRPA